MRLCGPITHVRVKIVSMDIFQKAIAYEGGITNLARALGLSVSRVGNWPGRGVPDGWLTVMQDRYGNAEAAPERKRNLPGKAVVGGSEAGV